MYLSGGKKYTAADSLAQFRLGRLRFHLHFDRPALLPAYKGSALRGLFGNALRETTCTFPGRQCRGCPAGAHCLYAVVFETAGAPGRHSSPKPYLLKPSLTRQRRFQPGDALHFDLLLIGRALDLIPRCITIVETMGCIGIGPDKGTFWLDHLTGIDATGAAVAVRCPPFSEIGIEMQSVTAADIAASNMPKNVNAITLELLTPLRINHRNVPCGTLTFSLFLGALLRRLKSLAWLYQEKALELDYHGLTARAQRIEFKPNDLFWHDRELYSNRQNQKMKLGGLVGTLTFQGDLREFLPYIALGEWLHVGKGATFGLGMYRVVENVATRAAFEAKKESPEIPWRRLGSSLSSK